MQQYIIHSFKKISDNSIWVRQEVGQNSGGYMYNNQVKRLNDFICDGEFRIQSVYKGTIGASIFNVGDKITTNGSPGTILCITIEMSNVILFFKVNPQAPNQPVLRVQLQNATKYIEPMAVKTQPKKATKKSVASEVIEENKEFAPIIAVIEKSLKPVRLEKTLKNRKETVEEFLIKFFKTYNNEKNTIFVDTLAVQCTPEKRRSLGDIYMILKYYYPDVTLNEVLNLLYNVLPVKLNPGFRTSKCSQILKRVWYYNPNGTNNIADENNSDEYSHRYSWYKERIIK